MIWPVGRLVTVVLVAIIDAVTRAVTSGQEIGSVPDAAGLHAVARSTETVAAHGDLGIARTRGVHTEGRDNDHDNNKCNSFSA
jgi:hypothetical protein